MQEAPARMAQACSPTVRSQKQEGPWLQARQGYTVRALFPPLKDTPKRCVGSVAPKAPLSISSTDHGAG